jgi:CRISPR type IV-associated protein Csf2
MAMEILGPLVLTSPAHQAAIMGKGEKGPRRTLTLPVFDLGTGTSHQVPYITANSVRGRLRRLAAERVFKVFEAKHQTLSRDVFLAVSRGSTGRTDINLHGGADAIVESARHVFAGLFGGGAAMLASRFSVAPLLPLIEWTNAVLPNSLQRYALPASSYTTTREVDGQPKQSAQLTAVMLWTARDPLMDGQGSRIVEDYAGTLAEWLGAMEAEAAEHKSAAAKKKVKQAAGEKVEEEDESKSALKNFGEIRVIPPGMPLQFVVTTSTTATLAQEGLLLMAIQDWCRLNSVGGGTARGMGRFNARALSALVEDEDPIPLFRGDNYDLNLDAQPIASRIDAAETALAAITADSIARAFGLAEAKPLKKGKGGARAEAEAEA